MFTKHFILSEANSVQIYRIPTANQDSHCYMAIWNFATFHFRSVKGLDFG